MTSKFLHFASPSQKRALTNPFFQMSDASESNSDYEVHVASLSSAAGAVPNSDKSSKICVIWNDSTGSYNPSQIRAHTAALQSKMNRARSVSHV